DEGAAVAVDAAGRREVTGVRGRFLQLAEVHRIGRLGARGHVGDLALRTRVAHRYRVLAAGVGAGAQCNTVVGVDCRAFAHRGGAHGVGPTVPAQRGAVI